MSDFRRYINIWWKYQVPSSMITQKRGCHHIWLPRLTKKEGYFTDAFVLFNTIKYSMVLLGPVNLLLSLFLSFWSRTSFEMNGTFDFDCIQLRGTILGLIMFSDFTSTQSIINICKTVRNMFLCTSKVMFTFPIP